tara:strand:+ start:53 stop:388 length:336 start_codon:yes stop_codon:yes gene_type:complete
MKVNGLRMGNYVINSDLQLYKISWIHIALESKGITPVESTQEWLLNLGFDEGSDIMGECFYLDKLNLDFSLHPCNKGLGFMYNFNEVHVKYVHQLQNLYFALTGQELTIKQ